MKNWKSVLLLVLVFGAGIVAGAVGMHIMARHWVQRAIVQPERVQNFVERDLAWKLRLDKPQRVKLHEILSGSRGQLRELRQQIQPQSATILSNANVQITAMLSSEQAAQFEEFKRSNALFPRPQRPSLPPLPPP